MLSRKRAASLLNNYSINHMDPMNQMSPQVPQSTEDGGSMKWVVIAVVVVVILVAVGWMFMRKEAPAPAPQQENTPTAGTQAPSGAQVPQATGNVDNITSTLLSAVADEALVANAGDNDISLITSDADAVSGMNTLYNDNEF